MRTTDSRLCRPSLRLVWILSICLLVPSAQPVSTDQRLAVIERDTLQTRNFVPVVNHHVLVANLSEKPLAVTIVSPVPAGLYRKDGYLSAFGNDSLLGAPLFAPFTLPIDKQVQLPKPALERLGQSPSYVWKDAQMEARQAVIAQYDSYFGPASQFWRPDGLAVVNWRIIQRHELKQADEGYELNLTLELANQGEESIEDAFFRIFVPEAVALPGQNDLTPFIAAEEVWASDGLGLTRSSMSDGQGNAAQGLDASQPLGVLKPGQRLTLVMRMRFRLKTSEGRIFPVLTLLGRQKGVRIWPASVVRGGEQDEKMSFHYLFYNLALPDRWTIVLEKQKVDIKFIENMRR